MADRILRSGYVMTVIRGNPSRSGVAQVSNSNYHMILAWWGSIPDGKWDAELHVTCTGPVGRHPLAVQIRAIDKGWGLGTTYAELTGTANWHVPWTDGERIVLEGPGQYHTALGAHVDYWQQVRNHGLVIMAESGQSAGVTYSLRGDLMDLHLRRV